MHKKQTPCCKQLKHLVFAWSEKMRIELDVSLENPTELFNLASVENSLVKNNNYSVLHSIPNHYLLLENKPDRFNVRIHEDGRIYIKSDFSLTNSEITDVILKKSISDLNQVLIILNINFKLNLRHEYNFSFYGASAHSFFWKKYDELNEIGKEYLINYNLRTFAHDDDSIHIKLESFGATTTFSS